MKKSLTVPVRPLITGLCAIAMLLTVATSAPGIPAFARKYGTSCLTCHTVYPKLNPFGEGFRRNGFRFPGVDSDFWKQEPVPLGQDAQKKQFPHSVWPGSLTGSVPLAIGFNGQAVAHPNRNSGGALADNRARFTLHDLIEEGHLWAGGSFDDKFTFFGELTVSESEGALLELAYLRLNDLVGPKHAVNLGLGKLFPTISAFAPHSTYVGDAAIPPISATALFGATSPSWNVAEAYDGVELNGTAQGRLEYSVGTNAGANVDVRDTENIYAHLGYKLGGIRLDDEGASGPANPMQPWAETAITFYGFWYRSVSHFVTSADSLLDDESPSFGGALRAQWRSLELNSGVYREKHDHALATGEKVKAFAQFHELSWVAYPWLVPAVRVEHTRLEPEGAPAVWDLRVLPGVAMLLRPNLRLNVIGQVEKAKGAPDAGWGEAGGFAAPLAPGDKVKTELVRIAIGIAWAF